MSKGLFGVGYGSNRGLYSAKEYPIEYKIWHSMLSRCYYYDAYKNKAIVADVWHNFGNFCEWVKNNKWFRLDYHLDKDILSVDGGKIYSPEMCVFVPRRINNAFTERTNLDKKLPLGVSQTSANKYKCRYYDSNGVRQQVFGFYNPEDAYDCFVKRKEIVMKELADIYKDNIDPRVYFALKNFKQTQL